MEAKDEYKDEISLKELIIILMKEKKIILTITSVSTILAIILSFLIITPIYESTTTFVMTIPDSVQTKVGTYKYITTSYSDYLPLIKDHRVINMTIDELDLDIKTFEFEKMIEYTLPDKKDESKRGIDLTISGEDAEESTLIANTHLKNYISFLNINFKDKAIDQFVRDYSVSLELADRDLEMTQKRLDESNKLIRDISPVITLQKALTSNPEIAAKYAEDRGINVKDLTRDMLYDEVINPNYASMESIILEYRKAISNYTLEKIRISDLLDELSEERKKLINYRNTGDASVLTENYLELFDSKIQIMSPAVISEEPVATSKVLSVFVGLVFGLMIGVFVAFFKAYWESN